jgi:hypothetical protein
MRAQPFMFGCACFGGGVFCGIGEKKEKRRVRGGQCLV